MTCSIEEGWIILDARGRRWDGHLYPSEDAAEATARACITGHFSVRHAQRVESMRQVATTLARPRAEWIIDP